jgi:hypothetical protein
MKNLSPPKNPTPFKTAAELVNPPLARAHEAWQQLAASRFAPARKEIVPSRFKEILNSIFLVDVVDGGADFRLALAGDRVLQFLGSEFKVGKLLTQISRSPFQERSILLFRRCVSTKAPVGLGPVRTLHDARDYLDIEAVIMPLSDDGSSVTGLLGAVHFLTAVVAHKSESARP